MKKKKKKKRGNDSRGEGTGRKEVIEGKNE